MCVAVSIISTIVVVGRDLSHGAAASLDPVPWPLVCATLTVLLLVYYYYI
jgi:hypothetical protein